MENSEFMLKQALIKYHKKHYSQVKGSCLTDNEMASMLDGVVPEAERDVLLEHVLSCAKCSRELKDGLTNLENFKKQGLLVPPPKLLQSAMDLAKTKKTDERIPLYLFPPLEIENYSVRCYELARAGRTARPRLRTIRSLCFVPNSDGFVYLFQVGRKKADIVLEKQRVIKGIKEEIISKIKKPLIKKGLVLIYTRRPLKNVSAIKNILLKTFGKSSEGWLDTLTKRMTNLDAVIKIL